MLIDQSAKATALGLVLAGIAAAAAPKFSGYVTTSWNKDLNAPAGGVANPYNFYGGKESSFQLNAAHLAVTAGDSGLASLVAELDAGSDATRDPTAITSSGKFALALPQAYVSTHFGRKAIALQAGKFSTSEGIEVPNSAVDPTISRGVLYGQMECLGHVGAVLSADLGSHLNLAAGAVEGWDTWTAPAADGIPMAYGRVFLGLGAPLSATFSAYYGPSTSLTGLRTDFLSLDLTGVSRSVSFVDMNFQLNYQFRGGESKDKDTKLYGAGLQPLFHLDENTQIGLRYELFYKDLKGQEVTINSLTFAPGFRVSPNCLLRAEYRLDVGAEKDFPAEEGKSRLDNAITAELNFTF